MCNNTRKLHAMEEAFLGEKYKGVTIASRIKFRNVRVEIRVKKLLGTLGLVGQLSLFITDKENQFGEIEGKVDIAEFDSIGKLKAKINYGKGESHTQIIPVVHFLNDYDQFIVVAI